jgi:hypothetical protein
MTLGWAPQQILLSSQSHRCILATQQFATWRMLDYPSAALLGRKKPVHAQDRCRPNKSVFVDTIYKVA